MIIKGELVSLTFLLEQLPLPDEGRIVVEKHILNTYLRVIKQILMELQVPKKGWRRSQRH